MSKYPDNPIVGILAKAIKQDWVQKPSTSEQHNVPDDNDINELKCRIQVMEECIKELETKIEFLMEVCLQLSEKSPQKDKKGKIKLPYPTTYISNRSIKINDDTDQEGQSNIKDTQSEEDSE